MSFCKYGKQLRTWEFAHRDALETALDIELQVTHAGAAAFFTKQLRMHMENCHACSRSYDSWLSTRLLMLDRPNRELQELLAGQSRYQAQRLKEIRVSQ